MIAPDDFPTEDLLVTLSAGDKRRLRDEARRRSISMRQVVRLLIRSLPDPPPPEDA
jgi:hypothetical protein